MIRDIIPANNGETTTSLRKPELLLEPMNNWHLYADFKNGYAAGGKIRYVWMLGIIGVFVLLLACVNFMNLATAKSAKHARDTGIRKTIGASRSALIKKFYTETLLVVMISFIAAMVLLKLSLPFFNEVAGKTIDFPWTLNWFWLGAVTFIILITIIAGSYPALYLSAFQPVRVLKGNISPVSGKGNLRRYLVVFQFTISMTLIICTVIVAKQIEHGQDRDPGYDAERLVQLYLPTKEIPAHFDALQNELKATGVVEAVALSESTATDIWSTATELDWTGKDPGLAIDMPITAVSGGYAKALGWKFIHGRNFSPAFASDSAGLILTESAVRYMALEKPINEKITWAGRPYHVIGVIKDVIIESPFMPVRPSIYTLRENDGNYLFVKLAVGPSADDAIRKIEPVIKHFNGDQPFDYRFVAEEYN
ncbi:MAG: FtsX-like permease family protein, partial [Sphingobacteriales bacterium]